MFAERSGVRPFGSLSRVKTSAPANCAKTRPERSIATLFIVD
jgi:hypothetical protein